MSKHTPGPCCQETYRLGNRAVVVLSFPIDTTDTVDVQLAKARFALAAVNACGQVNPSNPIAAAEALPDLLEACNLASRDIDGYLRGEWDGNADGWEALIDHIQTAIRKATALDAEPAPAVE